MEAGAGLTRQSLFGAFVAAYMAPLVLFAVDLAMRMHSGVDARICPAGSRDIRAWCTWAEGTAAFLLVFYWALFGLPFAFVLTAPCSLVLGRLAPALENRLDPRTFSRVQYGLGAATGVLAAALLDLALAAAPSVTSAIAGLLAGLAGAGGFRRVRYRPKSSVDSIG